MRRKSHHRALVFAVALAVVGLYTKIGTVASAPAKAGSPATTTYMGPTLPYQTVQIDGKNHRIYFTIDDHPGRFTARYLDTLKAYGIKATFFIVAYDLYAHLRSPDYEPLLSRIKAMKRAVKDGHIIGNHSVTHGLLCKMTLSQVKWEVRGAQRLIKQVLGIDAKYWRPPHGHICRQVQAQVRALNLTTIMWDVDDYRSTPQSMMRIIKQRVRHGNTYTVVLFHNKLHKFTKFLQLLYPARQNRPSEPSRKN